MHHQLDTLDVRPERKKRPIGFPWFIAVLLAPFVWLVSAAAAADAGSARPSHPGTGADATSPPVETGASRQGSRGPESLLGAAIRNETSGLTFPSLQSAVSAATAGDTLTVLALDLGEGPVVIDRNLTLRGATGAEVLRATADTGDTGDARAWILIETGVDVAVEDLGFDGDGRQVYQALRVKGTVRVERAAFRDIRFGTYQGAAVVAFGDGPSHVVDSTFEAIGRQGVFFFGAGVAGSSFEGSTYTGKGDGDHLDYGIELGGGAEVTIRDSRLSDCRGVASVDDSASSGILVSTFFGAGTSASVESSELLANTFGVLTSSQPGESSQLQGRSNRFFGNTEAGLLSGSSVAADFEDNWWGCNEGPAGVDCDSILGSGTVDADPWLLLSLTVNPSNMVVGSSAAVLASLRQNSDSADTSPLGTVRDGIPVLFDGGVVGEVMPMVEGTTMGTAPTTFTATADLGGEISASVDGEVVSVDVTAVSVLEIPTLGSPALLLLLLLLGLSAVARMGSVRRDPEDPTFV
ncbi:MAG: right-handed parallel beta-helix repeat-containing protein [Holophagales bacterium]|nr:right-handed parallel beta-helix repeat-containing protein [Holophagales bacterium]